MNTPANYHLQRGQENLGVFPLDELHRMRDAGTLDGTEWVWRAGMSRWESLDTVLYGNPGNRASPPSLPKNRKRLLVWTLLPLTILVFAGLALGLWLVGGAIGERFDEFRHAFLNPSSSNRGVELARPIAVSPNTMTAHDVRESDRDFRLRHYLETYRENGRRDHACDAESLTYLRMWLAYHFGGEWPESPLSFDELRETLLGSKCIDPLVLAIAAMHGSQTEQMHYLHLALEGLAKSVHAPYPRFWITVVQADNVRGDDVELAPLDAAAVDLFADLLAAGNFPLADQQIAAESLLHGWGKRFLDRNADQLCALLDDASPEFEWLRLVVNGERHVIHAWRARGGGFAHTVSPEGWEGFRSHLAEARASFEQAWKMNPGHPLVPSRMIYVAMGQSRPEDMRLWFDLAVEVQIDYLPAWNRMRWALRPRWHGSHEAMLAFGMSALDTNRFDTNVPLVLYDVVRDIGRDMRLPEGEYLFGREDIWPHIEQMYNAYITEPTQEHWLDGWRSAFASIAYHAGKYDVAREQLEATTNWTAWESTLAFWKLDPHLWPLEVAARTGSHGPRINEAEDRWKRQDRSGAARAYQRLLDEDLDESTRDFVNARLAALGMDR